MARFGMALSLAVGSAILLSHGASAAHPAIYASAEGAQTTCPSEEVVWLDLQFSKYYHKTASEYGQRGGAYACVSAAHAKGFREAKLAPVETATK